MFAQQLAERALFEPELQSTADRYLPAAPSI